VWKKLYSNFNALNWYWKAFFVAVGGALLYFVFTEYYLFIAVVTFILLLQYLWQFLFCRARVRGGIALFNLSLFAEVILMIWYLSLAISIFYGLYKQGAPWYGYLFSSLVALVKLVKVLEVFSNRRDFIQIETQQLTWRDDKVEGTMQFESYLFDERKTEAFEFKLSGDATGPFLIVKDAEGKEKEFDLKQMNLGGHARAMKKYFEIKYTR
jgi:hypothetical protein